LTTTTLVLLNFLFFLIEQGFGDVSKKLGGGGSYQTASVMMT